MKKIIVVLLLAFLSMGFQIYVPENDPFGDKVLDNWVEVRDFLRNKGIEIEAVLYTQRCLAKPESEYITIAYLEKGVKYGQIGYSDAANIQLCYAQNLDRGDIWRNKKWTCSKISKGSNRTPFLGIEVKETGQYLLKIKTLNGPTGIHQTSLQYMFRPGKGDKTPSMRQDQYYDIYGSGINQ